MTTLCLETCFEMLATNQSIRSFEWLSSCNAWWITADEVLYSL